MRRRRRRRRRLHVKHFPERLERVQGTGVLLGVSRDRWVFLGVGLGRMKMLLHQYAECTHSPQLETIASHSLQFLCLKLINTHRHCSTPSESGSILNIFFADDPTLKKQQQFRYPNYSWSQPDHSWSQQSSNETLDCTCMKKVPMLYVQGQFATR